MGSSMSHWTCCCVDTLMLKFCFWCVQCITIICTFSRPEQHMVLFILWPYHLYLAGNFQFSMNGLWRKVLLMAVKNTGQFFYWLNLPYNSHKSQATATVQKIYCSWSLHASCLRSDKSSPSCAKIALCSKNCATAEKHQNCAKLALHKIAIFCWNYQKQR